jgi:hypothetical protein
MGWGRYSTSDIERLMRIAVIAIIIGVAMPTYVQLRDHFLGNGAILVWYHHWGLAGIALTAGSLTVLVVGGLIAGMLAVVDKFMNR